MKITPLLIAGVLASSLTLQAEDEKKAASPGTPADKESTKADGADGSWAEVEPLLKKQPRTRDEAKEYITEFDEKSGAFLKAYPSDARRWKLKSHEFQINRLRGMVGLKAKSDEEINKLVTEILEAKDADEDAKGFASFMRVQNSSEEPEEFKKLAETHVKTYPDFRYNGQIQSQLKTIESEKALKEKPLEMSFKSTEGKEIDLAKMRGKVVLVDFWATWCGPCVAEIPNVVATYNKLHDKGFEIVGISFDKEGDEDKLAEMTKEKKMPWPQYFDGAGWKNKFGQQYGINSIPKMWLVNKKGMVVDTNAREDLAKKVEKLLAE